MRHSAWFAWRFPPGLSRRRVLVLPEPAGIGATPHRCAQAASERMRLALSPAVNFLLFRRLLRGSPANATLVAYVLFIPANALVIGIVMWFANNDALVAALVGLALLARFQKKFVLVGVCLGLAILLKLYPAALVPFFCLDRRRFNLRPLAAAACTAVAGFGLGLAIWVGGYARPSRVGSIDSRSCSRSSPGGTSTPTSTAIRAWPTP